MDGGGEGDGVYCGATGAALFALSLRGTRDGRGARWRARRTPFCGKLKSPPGSLSRLDRAFRTRQKPPACPTCDCHDGLDIISQ